jgi:hypothetical protein
MKRLIVSIVAVLAGVAFLAPWGLYALGLSNVEGRPNAQSVSPLTSEDDALLRRQLKAPQGLSVMPLSPGGYLITLITSGPRRTSAEEGGTFAAWIVARHYNATHLKSHRMIWWHLSGAALTIWITRNWTPDQVLSGAAEIVRQHSTHAEGTDNTRTGFT